MPKVKRPEKPPFTDLRPGQQMRPGTGMRHERLVGRLSISWSNLENVLEDLVWQCFSLPIEYGRILTKGMQVERKIRVLRDVSPLIFDGEVREVFETVLIKIDQLRDDRNFILHGSWGHIEPEGDPVAMSLRPNSPTPDTITTESFPATRMYALIANIEDLKVKVTRYRDLMEERPPAPGMPGYNDGKYQDQ